MKKLLKRISNNPIIKLFKKYPIHFSLTLIFLTFSWFLPYPLNMIVFGSGIISGGLIFLRKLIEAMMYNK